MEEDTEAMEEEAVVVVDSAAETACRISVPV